MNRISCLLLLQALVSSVFAAGALTGYPFQDETLHYSVNWPSGLSTGDATLTAHRSVGGWDLTMSLNAGVPGFNVADSYHSLTNAEGCSLQFSRSLSHGGKKTSDTTTFDYHSLVAHRVTTGGGRTDLPISLCARDALALVYFARVELGQGRVPPPQDAFFGAPHSVHMEYTGAQTLQTGGKPETADHIVVSFKGSSSDIQFEILFARDAARTPLSVKAPFSVGTLIMDLVR